MTNEPRIETIQDGIMTVLGDCMDVFPLLPDKSVDLVLCDPPYGTTACKWDSVIPLEPLWKELCRITKPGCAIIMTASQPFTSRLIMSRPKLFKVEWIWRKNLGSNFGCVKWMPMKEHESVLVFSRDGKSTQYHPIKQERSEAGKKIAAKGMKGRRTTKKSSIYENGSNPLIGGFEEGPSDPLRCPSSVQSFECAPEEHHESVLVFSRDGKRTQYYPIKQERSEKSKENIGKEYKTKTENGSEIHSPGFRPIHSDQPLAELRCPSSVQSFECAPEEHHESVLVFSRDGESTQYHPIKQERSEGGKKIVKKGIKSNPAPWSGGTGEHAGSDWHGHDLSKDDPNWRCPSSVQSFDCAPEEHHESVLVFSRDGKKTKYYPIKQRRALQSNGESVIADMARRKVQGLGARDTNDSTAAWNKSRDFSEIDPNWRCPSSVQSFECAPEEHHESVLVFSRDGKRTQYYPIKQERSEVGKKMVKKGIKSQTGTEVYGAGLNTYVRDTTNLDPDLRCPSSVQDINVQRGLHPTQKPVALMTYMIKTYSQPGETVLDFAMGSGTTGVACVQTGRDFIGVEMDLKYFEIANKRIKGSS